MKISFSFSSSSSFDGNLSNSPNAITCCLSVILRRFLCTRGLSTHPFDPIKEQDRVECNHQENLKFNEKSEAPTTPGIVARLMGLESLPENNSFPARSRSVNSADYLSNFEPRQRQHRCVKTSLSLVDVPVFLELENDDFFILNFENAGETEEFGRKCKKSEMGFGESEQRRAGTFRDKENRSEIDPDKKKKKEDQGSSNKRVYYEKHKPKRNFSDRPSKIVDHTNDKKNTDTTEFAKKKKKPLAMKKVEPECDSENSSPVSVLDLGDFLIDSETPTSEEDLRPMGLNPKRKLPPKPANSDNPLPLFSHITMSEWESRSIDRKCIETKEDSQDYLELWEEISKMVVEDLKESNWISRETSNEEYFEEIVIEFGLQILDKILHSVLLELAEVPVKNFTL